MADQMFIDEAPRAQAGRAQVGRSRARFSLSTGRFHRKAYWLGMGTLTGIGAVVTLTGHDIGMATAGPSVFLMIRRLHDFNRSGWWSLAILLGPVALMLALLPFATPTETMPFVVLLSLVWSVWLGCIPGDPHANRFGPPMGAPDLEETFS